MTPPTTPQSVAPGRPAGGAPAATAAPPEGPADGPADSPVLDAGTGPVAEPAPMTHRQILEALSGLLLGMFVAILSSTVVSNALPTIIPDLGGGEAGYTWVVTAALLATTVSTPVWGKLADLFSKKLLVQSALVIFVLGSVVAGLSTSVGMLIACRVVQGIGAGGLTALAQVVMATIISPRERGRYSGYLGATFALATVAGPLIGGVLTEHLSWHWCFFVGIPFAVAAFFVLQRTLDIPVVKREVSIDYAGALLLAAGASSLLIWVSLAGQSFAWASWQTVALVVGGFALLGLFVLVESRAKEPIVPLRLFRSRTVTISALASLFVGVALFGATIFLSQYFQLARGESPTAAGLLTLPMIFGLVLSSTVAGRAITRTGRWKSWLLTGGVLLTVGLALMSLIEYDTPYWNVAIYMALVGLGVGMMMQNLVLAVQNVSAKEDLGVSSSLIAFTRTLGGAIGVAALGAVLAHRITSHLETGLTASGLDPALAETATGTGVPDLSSTPEPVRTLVQSAVGLAVSDIFLVAAPCALVALVLVVFIKEVALRDGEAPALRAGAGAPAPVTTSSFAKTPAAARTAPERTAPERTARADTTATGSSSHGQHAAGGAPDAVPAAGQEPSGHGASGHGAHVADRAPTGPAASTTQEPAPAPTAQPATGHGRRAKR